MHEMSIATSLLDEVLAALSGHDGARVDLVELEVGSLRLIVPEAMDLAWRSLTVGTPAAGSALKITEIEPFARCRVCGCEYRPELISFLCPKCGKADVDILSGNDIILKSLVCGE